MMAYTHINLYVPMAMMGVAFSLIPAVMWPRWHISSISQN